MAGRRSVRDWRTAVATSGAVGMAWARVTKGWPGSG
jgi:hypothetical protein